MSAKQYNLQPSVVFEEASVSASKTSDATEVLNKDNLTYQLLWTGTLAGTFDIQVSSNYDPNKPSLASWDSLPLTSVPTAAGSPDSWTVDLNQLGSKWVRCAFTRVSGTGNLKMIISGKAI